MHQGVSFVVFLDEYRSNLLAQWSDEAKGRGVNASVDVMHVDNYVHELLDEIARAATPARAPDQTAVFARRELEHYGAEVDLESVIREFSVVRGILLTGIGQYQVSITAQQLETFNQVIDDAMLWAVRSLPSTPPDGQTS